MSWEFNYSLSNLIISRNRCMKKGSIILFILVIFNNGFQGKNVIKRSQN